MGVVEGKVYLFVLGGGRGGVGGGATVASRLEHRIAMAFLCLGLAAKAPITVDDGGPIATSFPDFVPLMRGLGAEIDA
jgi:3-phosphoshikimate 1-carboxyvinyltransferase